MGIQAAEVVVDNYLEEVVERCKLVVVQYVQIQEHDAHLNTYIEYMHCHSDAGPHMKMH
jgi:hypothetical protein